MKEFFKMTLATICGIVLLSVVTTILFIISVTGMLLSETSKPNISKNSVYTLNLKGLVEERVSEDTPLSFLLGQNDMESMGLDDILASIRKAKEEKDIKGIYIEAGAVAFDSPAILRRIRDELKDFRKSGKWIVAYADIYQQGAYYLCSVADKVYLNTTGMLEFQGLGVNRSYMKGLYDKLGIKYEAVKVGKYKSAIESDIRTDMSAEDREQRTVYLNGIWQSMLKDIAESRKIPTARLDEIANDSIIAIADPKDYVKAGLIDGIKYPEEIRKDIKQRLGIEKDDDIAQLSLSDMKALCQDKDEKGERISVYYACGEIIDDAAANFFGSQAIVGKTMADDLRKLADDDDVKAVVLRVNSPGGSAVASEQIWHAVQLLKAKKPVVVSMSGVAASGGYMISAGANSIFAEPTTITGSIGIFGLIPNVNGLLTDKLGVTFDGVGTNTYTNWEDNIVFGKNNAEELRYMQSYVERGYNRFLKIVADGRKMSTAQVDSIGQGRVWLGSDALKIKLVDKLGTLDDAVKKAAELAKVKSYHAEVYQNASSWMDRFLPDEEKGSYLDSQLRKVLGDDLYAPVMELRRQQQRNRLQARLPFSLRIH